MHLRQVMLSHPSPSSHPPDVRELLALGDRACATRDPERLVEIARLIADGLGDSLELELLAVERLARSDLDGALRHWAIVSRSVRDWMASSYVHR